MELELTSAPLAEAPFTQLGSRYLIWFQILWPKAASRAEHSGGKNGLYFETYIPSPDFQEWGKCRALRDNFVAPYLSLRNLVYFSNRQGIFLFFQFYVSTFSFEKLKTYVRYTGTLQ